MKGLHMKKILASICAIAIAMTVLVAPARADNSEEIAIGIGAFLGGLIIGETLRPRYAPAPVYAAPVYVEPEPQYIRECYVKVVRKYDARYDRYVKVKRKVCEVVPNY
jgi:hypothetical protein